DPEAEVKRRTAAELDRPFDAGRGPLWRATLFRAGEEDSRILLTLHQLVADGWSTGVLTRDLGALYEAELFGGPAKLPPLTLQYADFSRWQRATWQGELMRSRLDYWKRHLAGRPGALPLPTDRPRLAVQNFR